MKRAIAILLLISMVLLCGCTSVQPTVSDVVPTPVTVTATYIVTQTPTETPGPTPTKDTKACFDRNITTPDYCYDLYYWVRPTVTPVGMGYSARVWKNDTCVYRNKTSMECEQWGDDSYTAIFMKNQTIVRNLSGINNTEVVSAAAYYNRTFDLNKINNMNFDEFVKEFWDGTYPGTKYDTSLFEPDPNVVIPVVNGTFNPEGF